MCIIHVHVYRYVSQEGQNYFKLYYSMQNCISMKTFSVVMLDEAHERTLNTDLIMGLLRKVKKKILCYGNTWYMYLNSVLWQYLIHVSKLASQYIPECKTHLLNTPVIRLVSLQIQKKREDLRLIVTSATLNAEVWTTFSAYLSLHLPILWNH